MKRKELEKELRHDRDVFETNVRKLFEAITDFDKVMRTVIQNQNYTYDQIIVIEKMATDIIALTTAYRDNIFFNKAGLGQLNRYLTDLGKCIGDLDDAGRAGDAIAQSIHDGSELCESDALDDEEDVVNLRRAILQYNIQLGGKMFEIRKSYQVIRSVLLCLRYTVIQDFTRILLGVDLIRDYKNNQKSLS